MHGRVINILFNTVVSRELQGAVCDSSDSEHGSKPEVTVMKVHHQPSAKTSYDPNRYGNKLLPAILLLYVCTVSNRYRLHFEKESQQELDLRKHEAKTKPLKNVAEVVYLTFTYAVHQ